MDIDNECDLKNIRWMDDFSIEELRMAKEYHILTKSIHESSLANKSVTLNEPQAVRFYEGML